RVFRCPYHFWTYGLDGRLLAAPEMKQSKGFKMEDVCLPQLHVETWEGFVFVNFDLDAAPLGPRLEHASELIKSWKFSEMKSGELYRVGDLPFNWKVMHENSIE